MMPDHLFAVGRGLGTILLVTCRAAERIIGPWGSFNFGPLAYLSLYILCHVMLRESLSFVTKGGLGVLPQKKF